MRGEQAPASTLTLTWKIVCVCACSYLRPLLFLLLDPLRWTEAVWVKLRDAQLPVVLEEPAVALSRLQPNKRVFQLIIPEYMQAGHGVPHD